MNHASTSIVNTSPTKQLYSFPKAPRFIKGSTPAYYNYHESLTNNIVVKMVIMRSHQPNQGDVQALDMETDSEE